MDEFYTFPACPAADNGVQAPQNAADVAALNMNVEIAKFSGGNPNAFYPLPAQKLFSASFDRTSDVVGVTVAWFTLTIDLSAGFCPQLLKNSFVWMQLVPRNTITLQRGRFYDGIRWLGAQNFLAGTTFDFAAVPWGIGACGSCRVGVDTRASRHRWDPGSPHPAVQVRAA
jgi:hypothetical protein